MHNIEYSLLESKRFGLNVFRGSLNDFKPNELRKQIIDSDMDLLILRLPSFNKSSHNKLSNLGFEYLHADTLVYYTKDFTKTENNKSRNELSFIPVTNSNIDLFDKIIPTIFSNYQNHYFSNTYLNQKDITDGYIEWAKNHLAEKGDSIAWYVHKEGKLAGFATCTFNNKTQECVGVLYGVMPEFSGGGIYADIMRFTQDYFKNIGYKKMLVSTQIQNYAVQKVWVKEGFYLTHSYETYHINSMLHHSSSKKIEVDICISEKNVLDFADFSGDRNKLHFDRDFAKALGFADKITHGMIVQSFLSKIFGVDYPGMGTVYLTNSNIFLSPLYINKKYKIIISTIKTTEKGFMQVLAKVIDENNKVCLLSYNNLIKR